jgi:hypothetical protein
MTDMPLQWNICTLLCADTRGHGRYTIKKFETEWLLELNGELIRQDLRWSSYRVTNARGRT